MCLALKRPDPFGFFLQKRRCVEYDRDREGGCWGYWKVFLNKALVFSRERKVRTVQLQRQLTVGQQPCLICLVCVLFLCVSVSPGMITRRAWLGFQMASYWQKNKPQRRGLVVTDVSADAGKLGLECDLPEFEVFIWWNFRCEMCKPRCNTWILFYIRRLCCCLALLQHPLLVLAGNEKCCILPSLFWTRWVRFGVTGLSEPNPGTIGQMGGTPCHTHIHTKWQP